MRLTRSILLILGFFSLSALEPQSQLWAADAATVKVKFQAAIVEGAKPLKDDIKWSITPVDKNGTAKQEVTKAAPELALLPAKYRVTATLDFASVTKDVNVTGDGKHELVFNAGWARFQLTPNRKAKPVEDAVNWQIYRYSRAGVDESKKVTELNAAAPQLTLPPGWYTIRAKYQGIMSEMVSEVKAGTLYKYTVVAYAGKATFAAVDSKGKAVKKDIVWTIERAGKDKASKRTPVTTDKTAAPQLLFGEGKYVVTAKAGNQVGETTFEIKATKSQKVTVKLKPVSTASTGS